jgi:hypothetical protein
MTYSDKLGVFNHLLKEEVNQIALTSNYTIFGLPLIRTDFNTLIREIEMLPYEIAEIKYRFLDRNNINKILCSPYFKPNHRITEEHTNKLDRAIFKITPDIEPDIYHLFIYKNGKEEYHDLAFIPNYTTSVMMNKLFRNIKENDNLDALEESDDEAEFEDTRDDKYVYLNRSYKMVCEYNCKFKRWTPLRLAERTDKLVTHNQLSPNPRANRYVKY